MSSEESSGLLDSSRRITRQLGEPGAEGPWLDNSAFVRRPETGALISTAYDDPDFPDEFCGFLQRCVANVDAAEILLLLAQNSDVSFELIELRARLAPATLSEADIHRCLDAFQQAAIVTRDADRRFRYRPAPEHDAHVATLARLYIERPVTLFRVIYALRDQKIKTFADAFRLRG